MAADPFSSVLGSFGTRFDPQVLDATIAHWQPRVLLRQGQQQAMVQDIEYGSHARHRMDVFPVEGSGAPIVLFVHGGGFISGDKQIATAFYSNVGRYFASHGIVCACMNYRLAPAAAWPAAAQDIDSAAAWLQERGDLYGGDPGRMVVIGQSAGACHVATWLFDRQFEGGPRTRLKGAVLMSGFYEARPPLSAGQRAYFGDDPDLYPRRSPLSMLHRLAHPLLVTMAGHDPAPLRSQSLALVDALRSMGASPLVTELPDHNHVSPLMSLGSDNDEVGARLLRFVFESTGLKSPTTEKNTP